jgi:hypothetical protein
MKKPGHPGKNLGRYLHGAKSPKPKAIKVKAPKPAAVSKVARSMMKPKRGY